MINRVTFLLLALLNGSFLLHAQPKPTPQQMAWHDDEFYLFMHFGPNTFTGKEWGHGNEPEDIFNPQKLDCKQWCRIAKAAGAKGIIITAKHHDGFCLWPSKYSTHTVRESQWKKGKGDVLQELRNACNAYGLKFGVYISPWDRNHPRYGTPAYNEVYINTMKEIFAKYGPIWELWWDGANGEGPDGKKMQYDFRRFEQTVRSISPKTIVFSDIGPDCRWVGNENGIAATTNWNTLDTAGFKRGHGAPPNDTLSQGNMFGSNWIPAECDVSIRPGWFYHAKEDDKVKTPERLFDLYVRSVGRGANMLLNVPPDENGLIHANDSAALMGFKQLRDQLNNDLARQAVCSVYSKIGWQATTGITDGNASTYAKLGLSIPGAARVKLAAPALMNMISIQEYLGYGQQCSAFTLLLKDGAGNTVYKTTGTTIGHRRLLVFPEQLVAEITLEINTQKGNTSIRSIEAYHIDEKLAASISTQ